MQMSTYLCARHEAGEAVEVPLPEELWGEVEDHAGGADLCVRLCVDVCVF